MDAGFGVLPHAMAFLVPVTRSFTSAKKPVEADHSQDKRRSGNQTRHDKLPVRWWTLQDSPGGVLESRCRTLLPKLQARGR